jgi:thioesterase domain-containing protein
MAGYYGDHIRRIQPTGPYRLLGTSFGGLIAFELALQLRAAGEAVDFLGLLDTSPTACRWNRRLDTGPPEQVHKRNRSLAGHVVDAGERVAIAHVAARSAYLIEQRFDGELTFFYCSGEAVTPRTDRRRLWRRFARSFRLVAVPGAHGRFHKEPQLSAFSECLNHCLDATPPAPATPAAVFGERFRVRRDDTGEVLCTSDGRTFPIAALRRAEGSYKVSEEDERGKSVLVVRGWAIDADGTAPAKVVVAFLDGGYAGRVVPGIMRKRLAEARDMQHLLYSGFKLTIPLSNPGRSAPLRLFSLSASGTAIELQPV